MKINFGTTLLQVARQFADKEVLVNVDRDRRFTFMELHRLTNRICTMLMNRYNMRRGNVYAGLLENDNVGLLLPWIYKAEPTGAWLNYRDAYEEHMWQIDHVAPKVMFLENALLDRYYDALRSRRMEIICMDPLKEETEGVHCLWDLIEGVSDEETNVVHDRDEDILVYRFTGGTTGKGKCAMYTLGNFLAAMNQVHAHPENLVGPEIRHLHITPLSHASGMFMLPIYFKGGTQLTLNLPDLHRFCTTIQDEKVTSTFMVPTLLYRFLEFEVEKQYDLSSLSLVFYGASPMSVDKLMGLQAKFGNVFAQVYGATEAVPPVVVLGRSEHRVETEEDATRLGSAGTPLTGVEILIADDEGREMPLGETGEIWIRTAGVIKGYYKNPEQTAEEFQDGYWKSGDLGYLDEKGYVYIVDRKKDMIISGGFNVYPVEVEAALNGHPAVLMSAVVGIPHPDWGEAVHAEVVLKEGRSLDESELIAFCKEKKAKYKAPKSVTFVPELPLTVVGKVLRRKVREKYWKKKERKIH
jgi:acyl-CoA synthetase (AMP-forming)/AMP-acid ligase II